ncbi:MAG: hypothetical protein JRI68_30730 [Deltaproteobacteria bacterium]|nr:hypothetical protein [Deltaproteobacteria bacterium]
MSSPWAGPGAPWTIVVVLAALIVLVWIALRIRWWRGSQLRRARLGRPRGALEDLADGQLVTLVGELQVRGPTCQRFEDGEPAAACLAKAAGLPEHRGVWLRTEGQLRLELDDAPVALDGPVGVRVGSWERHPLAPWRQLARAVQSRIERVEPSAEVALASHAVVFRSLAAGDRVRARGVLTRLEPEDGRDYREPGLVWALAPQDGEPAVPLAFEGLPKWVGAVGSALQGIRRRRSVALVAAGVALLALGLVAAAMITSRTADGTAPATSAAPSGVMRLKREACDELAEQYRNERDQARQCSSDERCKAEPRGGYWLALDGCFRFVNPDSPSLGRANRVAALWLDGMCASDYEACVDPLPAMCRDGRCVERPPHPVPPTWNRHTVGYVVSFFLPPDLERRQVQPEDSLVRVWRSDRLEVVIDYGQWSNSLEDEPNRRVIEVDGRRGIMASSDEPFTDEMLRKRDPFVAVYVPEAPPCSLVRCGLIATDKPKMSLRIDCTEPRDCDDARLILRSITFW